MPSIEFIAGSPAQDDALRGPFYDSNQANTFEIELNMDPRARKLTFTLTDKDPTNPGSRVQAGGTSVLVVREDKPSIFLIALSDDWDWKFTDKLMNVSAGDINKYNARLHGVNNEKILEIHATPNDSRDSKEDKLDLIVSLMQKKGREVKITIDPVTENPPPRNVVIMTTGGPAPIA